MRLGCLLLAASLLSTAPAWGASTPPARPRVHVVYSGQRLASIAKRYNVTVEALCTANSIGKTDPIKPGQKLVIPGPDDKDGTKTRSRQAAVDSRQSKRPAKDEKKPVKMDTGALPEAERVHRVESGQRLESIAKRYGVTVDDLCEVNRLRKTDKLKIGQRLVIPSSGASTKPSLDTSKPSPKQKGRRGTLDLYTYTARWRGQATDSNGRVLSSAVAAISKLLGATGTRPRIDPRLIRLLVEVSNEFGGRPIRVVSGYRTNSYYDDSRHRLSRAIDFSIPGVSNQTLRDYLRRFERVGVGYYPNSSFVHLDVRETAAYWVDYSGPGEAPRTKPRTATAVAANDEDAHSHTEGEASTQQASAEPPATKDAPEQEVTKPAAAATPNKPAPTEPASYKRSPAGH